MHRRLVEILAVKKQEAAALKTSRPSMPDHWRTPRRDFKAAIARPPHISLIAEIKFASPSVGLIRQKGDPVPIGRIYEEAGAAAVSVLTDQRFFQGDVAHLPRLKKAVGLPVLRKDFIIDALQVRQSYLYGADALLLIARILPPPKLAGCIALCRQLGMASLTEVHSRDDLQKALDCGADIIGINNRDLDSFEVDLNTTHRLAPLIPSHCLRVAESGIHGSKDIRALKTAGIDGVLVGSALMSSRDPGLKARQLVNAGRMRHG